MTELFPTLYLLLITGFFALLSLLLVKRLLYLETTYWILRRQYDDLEAVLDEYRAKEMVADAYHLQTIDFIPYRFSDVEYWLN